MRYQPYYALAIKGMTAKMLNIRRLYRMTVNRVSNHDETLSSFRIDLIWQVASN